ncbi:MAG: hypothetical protein ACI89U_001806, partial [Gammaproteobacteria bacterium]
MNSGAANKEMETFLGEIAMTDATKEDSPDTILGPFSDIANQIGTALMDAVLPAPTSTLGWPLLLLTFFTAMVFWFIRTGRGAKDANGRERPMKF